MSDNASTPSSSKSNNNSLKKILPWAAIALILAGAYFLLAKNPANNAEVINTQQSIDKIPNVKFHQVTLQDVEIPVETRGNVNPSTQIQLTSEVNGVIVSVAPNFINGGFFNKGDWLVKVSRDQLLAELAQAKARLASAELNYARTKARVNSKNNIKVDGIRRRTDLARGAPQLEEARNNLEAARATYSYTSSQLKKTTITAPFTGRVMNKFSDVGEFVNLGKPLAKIYSTATAEIRLPLTNKQLELVNLPRQYQDETANTNAYYPKVTLRDSAGEHSWEGKLVRTEGNVDPRNRLMYVVAEVDAPYERDANQPNRPPLSAGIYVEASIEGKTHTNIAIVPRDAIRNQNQVWIIEDNQRLRIKDVDILYRGDDVIYIRKGLGNLDKVITSPLDVVIDGMDIQPINAMPAPNTSQAQAQLPPKNIQIKASADGISISEDQTVNTLEIKTTNKTLP